jgi:hypothetical protein
MTFSPPKSNFAYIPPTGLEYQAKDADCYKNDAQQGRAPKTVLPVRNRGIDIPDQSCGANNHHNRTHNFPPVKHTPSENL